MKTSFLAVALLALLTWGTQEVQAQTYDPYYYDGPYLDGIQYQQYPEQYDPYYELHVMHYQLYLQPYQSYQVYQPCCYAAVVMIPQLATPASPRPRPVIGPRPPLIGRK